MFADLSNEVYDYWDRGLLGLAVAAGLPGRPFDLRPVHVRPHPATTPTTCRAGSSRASTSSCPGPPGPTTDGCAVSARLSRLTMGAAARRRGETVLIEDWCQQFPPIRSGPCCSGRTARCTWGRATERRSASCRTRASSGGVGRLAHAGDPVRRPGGRRRHLRSQDLRTGGDPQGLDGSILRLDPDTGDAWPSNPNADSGSENVARIVATGFRNPFRFTLRQSTGLQPVDIEKILKEIGYRDIKVYLEIIRLLLKIKTVIRLI